MKFLGFLLFVLNSYALDNTANSCDDYISRHNKQDLVPVSFTYKDVTNSMAKEITMVIKNQGEVDMNSLPSDVGGLRNLQITMNGQTVTTKFRIPLDSQQSQTLKFNIKTSGIKDCVDVDVLIDPNHGAGQWGCSVWNNDHKTIKAVKAGSNCFPNVRLPLPPIQPIPH